MITETGENRLDEVPYFRLSHYKKKPHLQKTVAHPRLVPVAPGTAGPAHQERRSAIAGPARTSHFIPLHFGPCLNGAVRGCLLDENRGCLLQSNSANGFRFPDLFCLNDSAQFANQIKADFSNCQQELGAPSGNQRSQLCPLDGWHQRWGCCCLLVAREVSGERQQTSKYLLDSNQGRGSRAGEADFIFWKEKRQTGPMWPQRLNGRNNREPVWTHDIEPPSN